MFVICECGYDGTPVHGVYTSLHKAVCVAMRVEQECATDYGLSVLIFNVDQEIELETISDDKESSTSVKYNDNGIVSIKRLHDVFDTRTIRVELYNEYIDDFDINVTDLICKVCRECGFNISNTEQTENWTVIKLIKV